MGMKYSVGEGKDYREVILVNENNYSVSTAKQRSYLLNAIRDDQSWFYVVDVRNPKSEENVKYLENRIFDEIGKLFAMSVNAHIDNVTDSIKNYNKYDKLFRLKEFKLEGEFYKLLVELNKECVKRNAARVERRKKLRKEKISKLVDIANSKYKDWLLYKGNMSYNEICALSESLGHDFCRIREVSNSRVEVETHRSVRVSFLEIKPMIEKVINYINVYSNLQTLWSELNREFVNKRISLSYVITEVKVYDHNKIVFIIGCHKICFQQLVEAVNAYELETEAKSATAIQ